MNGEEVNWVTSRHSGLSAHWFQMSVLVLACKTQSDFNISITLFCFNVTILSSLITLWGNCPPLKTQRAQIN